MAIYLNNHKGVIVLTNIFIVNRLVLIVNIHQFQPLSCVEEVILGHVKRQSVDGGDVEHIGNGLVILRILLVDFPDGGSEMRQVNLSPISLYFFGLVMEVVASVSLHLQDQHRYVISLKLIRREYFSSGAMEVILLCPR